MAKKAILTLLASILVIVACAGAIIALVHSSKARSDIPSGPGSPSLGNVANISKLCTPAMYKESCERTLSQVSTNNSLTPIDVFRRFIEVAIKEFESAAIRSVDVTKGKTLGMDAAAVPLCKKFLSDGTEDLKELLVLLEGKDIQSVLADDPSDIKLTISAAMTEIDTCVECFDNPDLNNQMQRALQNATEMSSNALAVIASIAPVVEVLESDLNNLPATSGAGRRLMGYNLDEEGFPIWLSAGDRKLLQAQSANVKPDAVVAKDGSGQYKTITEAIEKMPIRNGRYVIYVKTGNYNEIVLVPKGKNNIFMYGDGAGKTMVIGDRSNKTGWKTIDSATFAVEGDGFVAKDMGFVNTAIPAGQQAVAFRTKGRYNVFYHCTFTGNQDTLYVQANRHFFRDCEISGTVDFIFGNSATMFQNCSIYANKPDNGQQITITASGRKEDIEVTGLVIQNCQIRKKPDLDTKITKSFLGRPWKSYARAVFMESIIDGFIDPTGWSAWDPSIPTPSTVYVGEFANTGPGAATAGRVKWSHQMTRREAFQYTTGNFIHAPGPWLAGTPCDTGFTKLH